MSLSEQTARVAGGGKNTLKTMLQKLGVSVGTQTIDQYPTLANQISNKLLPNNLISSSTATSLGLAGTATPNEAFAKIKALIDAANSNANAKCQIVSGSYVGVSTAEDSSSGPAKVFNLPFVAKALIIVTRSASDRSSDINSGPELWIAIRGATYVDPTYSSGNQKGCAEFVWSGATVSVSGYDTKYPNWNGSTYDWFALG